MKKRYIVALIIIIEFILLVLGLLSLFGAVDMDATLPIFLSAGLFNIANGYNHFKENKILAIFTIVCGAFIIFAAIFKTFSLGIHKYNF